MSSSDIKEHMEIIGADGVHAGTVDGVEGNRIKLTKADNGEGSHKGCADTMLSDGCIRDSTALALNQPASVITISDRQSDSPFNTYYTANTPRGSYRCTIGGGSISQLGITDRPECALLAVEAPPASRRRVTRRQASDS